MQRFRILGTLLVVSCGGHLDLGKDASGGTGGSDPVQTTGGSSSKDPDTGMKAEGGMTALGGASGIAGGKATTGGGKATSGGSLGSGGASGGEVGTRCAQLKSVGATGTWEGYSEDFLFKPIDKYRVEIGGMDETGSLCGSVTFGDADPLPPATDPEAAYPSGRDIVELKAGIFELWPGATYSITDGAERDTVVRFQVSAQEVMNSWCALQTVYPGGLGQEYGCLPGNGYSISWDPATQQGSCSVTNPDGTQLQTTAALCYQCGSDCACSESSCTSRMDRSVVFDLTLSQDEKELTGSVGGTSLRLTRVL